MSDNDRKEQFNNLIAVTIAVLASFTALCKVKDDNIVQAMQVAQASGIDDWAWYQALHVREDIAKSELGRLQALGGHADAVAAQAQVLAKISKHMDETKAKAEQDKVDYDTYNYRDDQFDLSDALISVAIALLAVTSLVQKKWLYIFGLVPSFFGVLMGLAGLIGWKIHPDALMLLLS